MVSAIQQCESVYMCPLLEPPSPPHRLLITERQVELPVLYGSFPLAVCFTHGHFSISACALNSSHPLLLPVCPQLCSLCLHLCSRAVFFYKLLFKRSVSVTAQESRWAQQVVLAGFSHICAITSALGRHLCSSWVFAHICPSVGYLGRLSWYTCALLYQASLLC